MVTKMFILNNLNIGMYLLLIIFSFVFVVINMCQYLHFPVFVRKKNLIFILKINKCFN